MAKQIARQHSATPSVGGRAVSASSHAFLLAGLGAASLARKQAIKAFDRLVGEGQAIRGSLQVRHKHVQRLALQRIERLRGAVLPLAADAMEHAGRLGGIVVIRAEPLLTRAGIVLPSAWRSARSKPVVAKAPVRKQAATRKATPVARKPVAPRKRGAGPSKAR